VEEFFAHMGNHVDRKAFDIDRIVVDGQDAVVLGRAIVTVRATGKLMDTLFAVHIVVEEDGRISRFVMFEDLLACLRVHAHVADRSSCVVIRASTSTACGMARSRSSVARSVAVREYSGIFREGRPCCGRGRIAR